MLSKNLSEIPTKIGKLAKIRLITIPKISMTGKCEPHFKIHCGNEVYNTIDNIKPQSLKENVDSIYEIHLPEPFEIKDDVLFECYSKGIVGKGSKIFQFWFNVSFVNEDGVLIIHKNMLDKAYRDKKHNKFDKNFRVELEIRFNSTGDQSSNSLNPPLMERLLKVTQSVPFTYKKLALL